MSDPFRIERLAKQDRSGFDCGAEPLNRYVLQQAGQDQRRRVAACYLLIEQATDSLAGYYTLSAGSILLSDLPTEAAKKLPRYPSVPIARVGRLAIDGRFQGQKLGGVLLFDALGRAAKGDLGVFALVVDAKDASAIAFYEHHGFIAFDSAPRVLFLPISDALRRLTP